MHLIRDSKGKSRIDFELRIQRYLKEMRVRYLMFDEFMREAVIAKR